MIQNALACVLFVFYLQGFNVGLFSILYRCISLRRPSTPSELTSKYHAATSTFLETVRIFQGPGLPPSNAVAPRSTNTEIDLPPNYHPARKGQTTFFFRFPLPASSPSSITFGNGLARVTYEAKAGVEVFWKGDRRMVVDCKEIDVVEALDEDAPGADLGRVVVGEGGRIWTHARIIGGMSISGRSACCELHVKNNSTRKASLCVFEECRYLYFICRFQA